MVIRMFNLSVQDYDNFTIGTYVEGKKLLLLFNIIHNILFIPICVRITYCCSRHQFKNDNIVLVTNMCIYIYNIDGD